MNLDPTMHTNQPALQQSVLTDSSSFVGHLQCFCIMTNPLPCLHQSVRSAVTCLGSNDLITQSVNSVPTRTYPFRGDRPNTSLTEIKNPLIFFGFYSNSVYSMPIRRHPLRKFLVFFCKIKLRELCAKTNIAISKFQALYITY